MAADVQMSSMIEVLFTALYENVGPGNYSIALLGDLQAAVSMLSLAGSKLTNTVAGAVVDQSRAYYQTPQHKSKQATSAASATCPPEVISVQAIDRNHIEGPLDTSIIADTRMMDSMQFISKLKAKSKKTPKTCVNFVQSVACSESKECVG